MDNAPLVSISCITYNHVSYIRQCLDGFLMQKTNFAFEVLIHDDCSTDGTTEIIREYETKYPDVIKPLYEEENQWVKGRRGTITFNLPRAEGKYIAMCEGDDYWIDPLKLQKQVDFLENYQEYGMCYSRCNFFNQNKQKFEREGWGGPYVSFEDLLEECTVPTHTVMLRSNVLRRYVAEDHTRNKGWLMGDYPMWLWFAHESRIHFMKDITSVYRVLDNSASHSNKLEGYEKFMYSTYDMLSYFCTLYNCQSLLSSDRLYSNLFSAAVMYGNLEKEKEYFRKIKKTNIIQKLKHIICCNKVIYNLFASCLFYTK